MPMFRRFSVDHTHLPPGAFLRKHDAPHSAAAMDGFDPRQATSFSIQLIAQKLMRTAANCAPRAWG